jgi:hypothetical protein
MNNTQVFAEITKRGAVVARVGFSGGDDDGGCDYIHLENAEGEKLSEIHVDVSIENDTEDGKFALALYGPANDQFGSYAGEFHVHGDVVWDTRTRKAHVEGQQSHDVWTDL